MACLGKTTRGRLLFYRRGKGSATLSLIRYMDIAYLGHLLRMQHWHGWIAVIYSCRHHERTGIVCR
ncbi:hypothetical protein SERLADRAFT_467340 [Serpula lacrymans var. lacrymans S7.9]|uniref:Uncharacterized protein n=1 Tax=Serpula lacrymans var. lacrymans (strain S7.9) TaxID=578457 RepID=F8NW27_SERL9|nr:uncharacterized protein SERLADRAFT_467340 [Serpula lacrymans var. lacrymans S7.9]EGO24284.1 hypothetical protein SERLADRAFT_467340 [Serpula lacrymans var. lacrymans S7.9]